MATKTATPTTPAQAETKPKVDARPKAPRPRAAIYGPDQKITALVDKNPKKPGSLSHDRFAHHKAGMTVKAALDAGVRRADLKHDSDHKFIKID